MVAGCFVHGLDNFVGWVPWFSSSDAWCPQSDFFVDHYFWLNSQCRIFSSSFGGGCVVVVVWSGFGLFTALNLFSFFVESLILAQDERWRRA